MLKPSTTITESRQCQGCGYELRGLKVGGNCPECGEQIRSRPKTFGAREGNLSDAEPSYVRQLAGGFWLMSAGIILPIVGIVLGVIVTMVGGPGGWVAALSLFAAAACWCAGAFVISRPRPAVFAERHDPVLDNPKFRLMVRISGSIWIAHVILQTGYSALQAAGGPSFLEIALLILMVIVGLVSFVSLVPLCVYVSDLAFWMSDDSSGWRLRGAAWTMAIFGSLALLFTTAMALGAVWPGMFLVWVWIVVFIAQIVFGLSVIGCTRMATYTLTYQREVEGRGERISERIRSRLENRGGVVGQDLFCRKCGYNLRGSPNGGSCPECGFSYADITPAPIRRDPVRNPEDEAPIDLDETGEAQPIISRKTSINPDARANALGGHEQKIPVIDDDNCPIPLAFGDGESPSEDLPEDMQDPGDGGVSLADGDDGSIPFAEDDEFPDDRTV